MISAQDRVRVVDAIRTAETRTSGEIFCVVARQSSGYPLVPLAWAAVFALVVPAWLVLFTAASAAMIYVVQLAGFALALAVLSRPGVRFRLVPRGIKHDRAHATAMRQFRAQGLDKTDRRTGVLIFASEAERYAAIIADAGINEKVSPHVWDKAMADLVAAIRAGKPADGFVTAIEQCGAVLAEHFPLPPGARHPDQIPDKLVEF